eukprot:CAMPEP_0172321524 /NCGR_PEP_ID=MMETSP1058-20130122/43626_1 /TAXON_ID=83371 /ORGANISM="Detonula confervacea, Strain CCMP 353" /LENGTH=450 /DNA_ID=CAMNT_0013037053 /DNA_START=1 /DNA_END=1350 /DNA_ORIENTATION=+
MMAYRPLCHQGTIAIQRIASKSFVSTVKNDMLRSFPRCAIHSTAYLNTTVPPARDDASSSSKTKTQRKRLDVALVGAPNAGKSQLLNSLIGSKVAAVSRKRHTTRTGILGARTFDDTQLVFIDTPGFLHHKMGHKEGVRKLLGEASSEMECADFTLLVVDAARRLEEDMKRTLITLMFMALRSRGRNEEGLLVVEKNGVPAENTPLNKFAVVVNKVDLVNPKEKLLMVTADVGSMAESCIRRLLQQRRTPSKVRLGDLVDSVLENYSKEEGFTDVHDDDIETFAAVAPEFLFVSAITKDDEGVDDVLGLLLDRATPSKHWIIDAESTTGMSPVEQVEEIIREKIYRCLHREVPHCVQQQNRMFRMIERNKGKTGSDVDEGNNLMRIHQDLVVKTKSHQRLVLGSGGKTLERIRSTALRDLEEAFKCEVDLEMNVRISKSNHETPLESDTG